MSENFTQDLQDQLNKALFEAVLAERTDDVRALLESGAQAWHRTVENNWTMLHWAAFQGNADIAELLIAHRAPVNATDSEGIAPLHKGAARGVKPVCDLLLAHGANPELVDSQGHTPVHWAAWAGQTSILVALIEHGGSLNRRDFEGKLPLDMAEDMGRAETLDTIRGMLSARHSKRVAAMAIRKRRAGSPSL